MQAPSPTPLTHAPTLYSHNAPTLYLHNAPTLYLHNAPTLYSQNSLPTLLTQRWGFAGGVPPFLGKWLPNPPPRRRSGAPPGQEGGVRAHELAVAQLITQRAPNNDRGKSSERDGEGPVTREESMKRQ